MRLISWTAACVCALASLGGLAACGSDSQPSASGSVAPSPTSASSAATTATSPASAPSTSGDGAGPCDAVSAAQIQRWAGVKVGRLIPTTEHDKTTGCRVVFDDGGSLQVGWTIAEGSLRSALAGTTLRHVVLAGTPAGEAFVAATGMFMVDIGIDGTSHLEVSAVDPGIGTPAHSKAQLQHLAEQIATAYVPG